MPAEYYRNTDERQEGFYSGLMEVWGPQTKPPVYLKSADGLETFTNRKSVMARWSEYFQKLLNVNGDIEPEALETYKSAVLILP